jgi:hypothetical protein
MSITVSGHARCLLFVRCFVLAGKMLTHLIDGSWPALIFHQLAVSDASARSGCAAGSQLGNIYGTSANGTVHKYVLAMQVAATSEQVPLSSGEARGDAHTVLDLVRLLLN